MSTGIDHCEFGDRPKVVEQTTRDSTLVDVTIKLAFVKPVADYPGPWWQWFDGVKSSQSLEILSGTMDNSHEAHKLRRALMMHQQRMHVAKVNVGSLALTPSSGDPPQEPGAAGAGMISGLLKGGLLGTATGGLLGGAAGGLLGGGGGGLLAAANKIVPVLNES